MKNRNVEFFNLSFLDLLSGALAAIIFLFIIVPKGNINLKSQPVAVTYDKYQKKFYGTIPEELLNKKQGDTILAIVGDFASAPVANTKAEEPVTSPPASPRRERPQTPEKQVTQDEKQTVSKITVAPSKLQGSKPDVPCKLSIELKWDNKKDNIDLFVCKDNDCVFGGRRYRSFIGYWDSGKARTSIFGGDLRTNQEAVRQFDEIIPGTYEILAQYKESANPKAEIPVRLQIYTKNDDNVERGNEHYFKLSLNPTERSLIARVTIGPNGEIDFKSFK